MRNAVIDIGTNSVKLLVGEQRGARVDTVHEEAQITRVGEGLEKRGRLLAAAMARTAETVRCFARIAEKAGASRIIAVGTAALRRAKNARHFQELARERAGLKVRILPASREALYSFTGGLSGLSCRGLVLLADVGGGSTEIVLGERSVPPAWRSVPFGAVSLTERFLRHDPPEDAEVSNLYEHAHSRLEKGLETIVRKAANRFEIRAASVSERFLDRDRLRKRPLAHARGSESCLRMAGDTADKKGMYQLALVPFIRIARRRRVAVRRLVIVGGTAAALGAILGRRHGDVIRRIELIGLFEKLRRMSVSRRVRECRLPRGRADIVVAGAAILIAVAQICDLDELTISRHGLRHGVLLAM